MPAHQFRQEYCCEFLDADTAVISSDLLDHALLNLPSLDLGLLSVTPFTEYDTTRYQGYPDFFLGLDLGQANDHTALCILERADVLISDRPDPVYFKPQTEQRYAIRHIERLPLGTAYPRIASHVAAVTRHPSLTGTRTLAIDA
ncbi:MAG: hypothetical protein HY820_35345, partial [Acidobacteria bacterium]|nr:hypothetical protein [Acidobacteriota bacterium]